MGRLVLRLLTGALVLLGLVLWQMPATVLDLALARVTEGGLRIAQAEGSVWQGRGLLASRTPEGSLRAWSPLAWRIDLAQLGQGVLGWEFSEAGRTFAHVAVDAGGLGVTRLRLELPPRMVLDALPHAVARAGWRGHLNAQTDTLRCDWRGACTGRATLLWRNAGLDLVPHLRFGDYRVEVDARGRETDFVVSTLEGSIRADASGHWDGRRLRLDGDIAGPPDVVGRLPNIAGPYVKPGDVPGQVRVSVR